MSPLFKMFLLCYHITVGSRKCAMNKQKYILTEFEAVICNYSNNQSSYVRWYQTDIDSCTHIFQGIWQGTGWYSSKESEVKSTLCRSVSETRRWVSVVVLLMIFKINGCSLPSRFQGFLFYNFSCVKFCCSVGEKRRTFPMNEWIFISQKFSDHYIISHASIHRVRFPIHLIHTSHLT